MQIIKYKGFANIHEMQNVQCKICVKCIYQKLPFFKKRRQIHAYFTIKNNKTIIFQKSSHIYTFYTKIWYYEMAPSEI